MKDNGTRLGYYCLGIFHFVPVLEPTQPLSFCPLFYFPDKKREGKIFVLFLFFDDSVNPMIMAMTTAAMMAMSIVR